MMTQKPLNPSSATLEALEHSNGSNTPSTAQKQPILREVDV